VSGTGFVRISSGCLQERLNLIKENNLSKSIAEIKVFNFICEKNVQEGTFNVWRSGARSFHPEMA
jgi:hypothetical protein